MLYDVLAMSVDPATGDRVGEPRTETIDTEANVLFRGCEGPWDVEDVYHAFWNRLNEDWEDSFPGGKEKVLVLSVEESG